MLQGIWQLALDNAVVTSIVVLLGDLVLAIGSAALVTKHLGNIWGERIGKIIGFPWVIFVVVFLRPIFTWSHHRREKTLWDVFGIPTGYSGIIEPQELVDLTLKRMALGINGLSYQLDQVERTYMDYARVNAQTPTAESVKALTLAKEEVVKQRAAVEKAQNEFYRIHRIAKKYKFQVQEHHFQYWQ